MRVLTGGEPSIGHTFSGSGRLREGSFLLRFLALALLGFLGRMGLRVDGF
jgi:hypothetical protein